MPMARQCESSKYIETKGRVVQTSQKGIRIEQSKKEKNSQRLIRKIVSNMQEKALSSLQTLKVLSASHCKKNGEKMQEW